MSKGSGGQGSGGRGVLAREQDLTAGDMESVYTMQAQIMKERKLTYEDIKKLPTGEQLSLMDGLRDEAKRRVAGDPYFNPTEHKTVGGLKFLATKDPAWKAWASGLDPHEAGAITAYTTSAYRIINAHARGVAPPPLQKGEAEQTISPARMQQLTTNLDSALAKGKLTTPMVTWRSVNGGPLYDGILNKSIAKGSTFVDKGYVSTTPLKGAATFFGGSDMTDKPVLAKIIVPRGMPAGFLPALGKVYIDTTKEHELLLPRGTKFEVVEAPKTKINKAFPRTEATITLRAILPGGKP